MSSGYYLLDHPNPHGPHYYASRRKPILGIAVHITAGLEDLDMVGPDDSAEATARYAATTQRQVSWHAGADSDTVIDLLPDSYTAWHARNYNSPLLGLEISKRTDRWADAPADWTTATLTQAARKCRQWCRTHGIPVRRVTREELDRHIATGTKAGLVAHADLDPTRRTDPGRDFPWSRFLALVAGEMPMPEILVYEAHRSAEDGLTAAAQRVAMGKQARQFDSTANPERARRAVEAGITVLELGGGREIDGAITVAGADGLDTMRLFAAKLRELTT